MKVRLVQKHIANADLRPFLEDAKRDDIDLICFAELATSGCLYTPREVPHLKEVLSWFEPYGFRIMTGLPYVSDEGLRNAYMYYHRGDYKMYYKVNLFPPMNEPEVYVSGTDVPVWNTDFGKIGVAICYDVRFPDLFEKLKESDARYIFIPAAFPRVRIDQWRELVIQRAKETEALVFAVNSVGDDGTNEFGGTSMVVSPDGEVLAESDQTSETTLDFELAVQPAEK